MSLEISLSGFSCPCFVEPLVHPGTVHLVGAGHVALATAHIVAVAGFEVVVIVTRGNMHDREVLAQALCTGAGYIGMIGSRRKRQTVFTFLLGEPTLPRIRCNVTFLFFLQK